MCECSIRILNEVGQCLVFHACGNDYRPICRMTYANPWTEGTLLVKHFLTHADYDKKNGARIAFRRKGERKSEHRYRISPVVDEICRPSRFARSKPMSGLWCSLKADGSPPQCGAQLTHRSAGNFD